MSGFRLLACLAHPDDEAFPMGGALAMHVARGVEVRLVTTTLGEEGEIRQPGAATPETLGEIRGVELACSVRALGLAGHETWQYRDSGMAGSPSNADPSAFVNAAPQRRRASSPCRARRSNSGTTSWSGAISTTRTLPRSVQWSVATQGVMAKPSRI